MSINKLTEKSRYERKYIAPDMSIKDVCLMVKLNPLLFTEIYNQRRVNSVYFDTKDLCSYRENMKGIGNRAKIRVRWYGEDISHAEKPNLEVKIKTGYANRKLTVPLESLNVKKSLREVGKYLSEGDILSTLLGKKMRMVDPIILISYNRKYFLSADKKYRLTIDTDVKFSGTDNMDNFVSLFEDKGCIVEIKYNFDDDDRFRKFSNTIPFRLSRCSKYVFGIDSIFGLNYDDS